MAKKKPEKDTRKTEEKRKDIIAKFTHYTTEWEPIRQEANEDMKYVSGDPFTEQDKRIRENALRPIAVNDVLHQFYNQTINGVRLNPRAVKFSPTGFGANDKTATLYNDLWREIEYQSKAVRTYISAFKDMVHRSYGWVRLTNQRENPRSDFHDLRVQAVPNPNMIVPDPDALDPTGADMAGLFAYQDISEKEFQDRYPDARLKSFDSRYTKTQPALTGWVGKGNKRLRLAEFWEVEVTRRRLMVFAPEIARQHIKPNILAEPDDDLHQQLSGRDRVGVFSEELDSLPDNPDDILDTRDVESRAVFEYITNGAEILEVKPWKGKSIPFVSCFGPVLYLDNNGQLVKQILSMTRLARNPYLALCYTASLKLEMLGMIPKFPYFAARGSLKQADIDLIAKSLREAVPVILYDDYSPDNPSAQHAPPMRQPWEPNLQSILMSMDADRRAVMDSMGLSTLPTPAQRNNEKTGAALGRIESSTQRGSFHYEDAYDAMIEEVGRKGEDCITPYYDTMRELGVRDARGRTRKITINNPNDANSPSTRSSHQVTVSSAPSEVNARDASSDFVQALLQSPNLQLATQNPIYAKVFAEGIRLLNAGPIGDQLADLFDPPQGQVMTPEQLQGQLGHAKQLIQQLQGELQKAHFEKQAKVVETEGKKQIEGAKIAATTSDKDKDRAVELWKAAIAAKLESLAIVNDQVKLVTGLKEVLADHFHEGGQNALDRQHERLEWIKDRLHERGVQAQDHANTMAQAAVQPTGNEGV